MSNHLLELKTKHFFFFKSWLHNGNSDFIFKTIGYNLKIWVSKIKQHCCDAMLNRIS